MYHRAIAFGQFGVTFGINAASVAIIDHAVGFEHPVLVIDSCVAFGRNNVLVGIVAKFRRLDEHLSRQAGSLLRGLALRGLGRRRDSSSQHRSTSERERKLEKTARPSPWDPGGCRAYEVQPFWMAVMRPAMRSNTQFSAYRAKGGNDYTAGAKTPPH